MTIDEKVILDRAINNALCFGVGLITSCRQELEDYGYKWRIEYELYILNKTKK